MEPAIISPSNDDLTTQADQSEEDMLASLNALREWVDEDAVPNEDTPQSGGGVVPLPEFSIGAAIGSPAAECRLGVRVSVGGLSADALVDTGATFSMVTRNWLEQHGLSCEPGSHGTFRGFGADNTVGVIGQVELSLTLDCHPLKEQKFSVVETGLPSDAPLVLGTDIMRKNKLVLDTRNSVIRFRDGT